MIIRSLLASLLALGIPLLGADEPAPPIHLAHTLEGKGPAIVFVHGLGGRKGVWKDVAARLRRDHTVVCVDLPGHGQSGAPPIGGDGAVDLPAIGRALSEFVAGLERDPVLLVGHSVGGPIAAEAVLAKPELYRGLVLVDSFLSGFSGSWPEQVAQAMAKDKLAGLKAFFGPSTLGTKQCDQVAGEAMVVDASVFVAYMKAITGVSTFGRAQDLAVPVLAIQSEPLPAGRDEKADLHQRGMKDIPRVQPVRFPRSKHWPMWDERDAFLKALAAFEKGLDRP